MPNKWNIPKCVLHDINHGKKFQEYGVFTYPIRNKNVRNKNNLTIKDIECILFDLKNTDLSMTQIGKKYNFGRDAISKINEGKSYPIKNYNYPARKTK